MGHLEHSIEWNVMKRYASSLDSSEDNITINEYDALLMEDNTIYIDLNAHLVILAYGLIMVVSLIGNLLVCKVAFSDRRCGHHHRTRTTTDLLIGSLAVSDLIMTIFNIPFNIARILLPHWPFGRFLCYGVPFVQTACVYVSTFTMTAIALHRWRTVSPNSYGNRLIHYSNRMLICIVWVFACVLAIPTVAFNTLKEANVNGERVIRCRVHYPVLQISMPLFLTIEIFLTQYVIPLLVTCALYTKIAQVVTKQGRLMTKQQSSSSNNHGQSSSLASIPISADEKRRRRHMEAKRRRIIMLALVVAVFAICWLPLNLYHLTIDLGWAKHRLSVFLGCHWLAMSSVCYNSLIYCWLNATFRQSAKQSFEYVFRCLKHHQSNKTDNGEVAMAEQIGTGVGSTVYVGATTTRIGNSSVPAVYHGGGGGGTYLSAVANQIEPTIAIDEPTKVNLIDDSNDSNIVVNSNHIALIERNSAILNTSTSTSTNSKRHILMPNIVVQQDDTTFVTTIFDECHRKQSNQSNNDINVGSNSNCSSPITDSDSDCNDDDGCNHEQE